MRVMSPTSLIGNFYNANNRSCATQSTPNAVRFYNRQIKIKLGLIHIKPQTDTSVGRVRASSVTTRSSMDSADSDATLVENSPKLSKCVIYKKNSIDDKPVKVYEKNSDKTEYLGRAVVVQKGRISNKLCRWKALSPILIEAFSPNKNKKIGIIDGIDDTAYMAQSIADGIVAAIAYLGLVTGLAPFVKWGADGLSAQYKHLTERMDDLKSEISSIEAELIDICENNSDFPQILGPKNADGVYEKISNETLLNNLKAATKTLSASPDMKDKNLEATAKKLEYLHNAELYAQKRIDEYHDIKSSTSEVRLAKWGMRSMWGGMVGLILKGSAALAGFIDPNNPICHDLAVAAPGIGMGASALMAVGQLFMMMSGIKRIKNAVHTCKEHNKKIEILENQLLIVQGSNKPNKDKLIKILEYQIKVSKSFRNWSFWSNFLPGFSLTVGQAAMFSWNLAAMVMTGLGNPVVGIPPLLIGLLVPGVALTLLATVPKVGLDASLESKMDDKFGQNDEDDGFDAEEFRKNLDVDFDVLIEEMHDRVELMGMLANNHLGSYSRYKNADGVFKKDAEKSYSEMLQEKDDNAKNFNINTDEEKRFELLFDLMKKSNLMPAFAEEAIQIKDVKNYGFDFYEMQTPHKVEKITLKKIVKRDLSDTSFNVPAIKDTDKIDDADLRKHAQGETRVRIEKETIGEFNYTNFKANIQGSDSEGPKISRESLKKLNDSMDEALNTFSKRQLRAEMEIIWYRLQNTMAKTFEQPEVLENDQTHSDIDQIIDMYGSDLPST